MYNFDYEKAASADDAVKAAGGSDDVMFLAGGMTLIPTLKLRLSQPEKVVDVGSIADLKGITVSGDTVTIGAATTHAEVAGSADVKKAIPALAKLASLIGDQQVRNRGTISHQHGVGKDHAPYLPVEKGELGMHAIRSLCNTFDPNAILNPETLLK